MEINKILKYIIIILLILFLILSSIYKFDSCNKCSFEIDNKTLNTNEFMDLYGDKCLSSQDSLKPFLPFQEKQNE